MRFFPCLLAAYASAIQLETSLEQLKPTCTSGCVPADKFDLSLFKMQMPYDSTGSYTSGSATSISQKKLATFSHPSHFYLDSTNSYIVFTTPALGVTTSGSEHPRVELREMTAAGANAAWGSNDGKTHTIDQTVTVTKVTSVSKLTVPLQVFDNTYGPFWEVFASDSTKGLFSYLFTAAGKASTVYIDKLFKIGDKFSLKTVIAKDVITTTYYNFT
jgi:hypothetical protein